MWSKEDVKKISRDLVDTKLSVWLVSAAGLMSADDNGLSDPYCEIWVWCPGDASCDHMWRSKTILETLEPMWDEKREVALTGRRALMHVVVFDWDKVGTDDFLGEALVVLDQYLDGEQHTLELELDVLEGNDEDGDISGTIRIELTSRERHASLAAKNPELRPPGAPGPLHGPLRAGNSPPEVPKAS